MGQVTHSVVVVRVVGDRCTVHPLVDGQYDRLEDALRDLERTAVHGYRLKSWDRLIAGRP
jgi:hypothetical protein